MRHLLHLHNFNHGTLRHYYLISYLASINFYNTSLENKAAPHSNPRCRADGGLYEHQIFNSNLTLICVNRILNPTSFSLSGAQRNKQALKIHCPHISYPHLMWLQIKKAKNTDHKLLVRVNGSPTSDSINQYTLPHLEKISHEWRFPFLAFVSMIGMNGQLPTLVFGLA